MTSAGTDVIVITLAIAAAASGAIRVIGAGGGTGAAVLDVVGSLVTVVAVVVSGVVVATVLAAAIDTLDVFVVPVVELVGDVAASPAGTGTLWSVVVDVAVVVASCVVATTVAPGSGAVVGAAPSGRDRPDNAAKTTAATATATRAATTKMGRLAARHRLSRAATPPCCPVPRVLCGVEAQLARAPWYDARQTRPVR